MLPGIASEFRLIAEEEVRAALDIPALVDAMAGALQRYSQATGDHPVRTVLPLPEDGAMFVMPAVDGVAAVKVVTVTPCNHGTDLPSHHAIMLAFDKQNGVPIAAIEATHLTEMRTAAASAAAARAMLSERPRHVAIIGSGVQARGHHKVFTAMFGPEKFTAWSPNAANLAAFCNETGTEISTSAEEAVRGADVVIAATSSTTPVINGAWVKQGAVVISVGAPMPQMRELDDALMNTQLFVDSTSACLAESGDVIQTGCEIAGEIGMLLSGELSCDPSRTRVFKSGGLAIEDAAAVAHVIERLR
jgi:ornithine cyclodeaminase/alanine dehydrogenase-like protein (mu-crystallin family)